MTADSIKQVLHAPTCHGATEVDVKSGPPEPASTASEASPQYQLECVKCGALTPGRFDALCKCGGMLDTHYDLSKAKLHASENPFRRFGDLLPVRDRKLYPEESRNSPCVHAKSFGQSIGLNRVFLKNEGVHPTGTTKDRSAIVSLSMILETGIRRFATSSTGNAGSAYAYALQLKQFSDIEMHLFVGGDFHGRAHYGDVAGVYVFALRGGSFVEAGAVAAVYARRMNMLSDGGFFSPGKREGAKLAYFEATDQIDGEIDWYAQAVSSGLGVVGTFKGAKELRALGHVERLPRLLCAQEEACAPNVRAWEEGCPDVQSHHIVHHPVGLAQATHRGDPSRSYPYLRKDVIESNGSLTSVNEAEIRDARRKVMELEGIDICFNAAVAVAGTIKEARRGVIRPDETVLVNLTGRDRQKDTATNRITWLNYDNGAWSSDDGGFSVPEEAAFRRSHDVLRSATQPKP